MRQPQPTSLAVTGHCQRALRVADRSHFCAAPAAEPRSRLWSWHAHLLQLPEKSKSRYKFKLRRLKRSPPRLLHGMPSQYALETILWLQPLPPASLCSEGMDGSPILKASCQHVILTAAAVGACCRHPNDFLPWDMPAWLRARKQPAWCCGGLVLCEEIVVALRASVLSPADNAAFLHRLASARS